MKRLVVDTNVLVAGFLIPAGTCGHIVRLIAAGQLNLLHDGRILGEYRRVFSQPEFRVSAGDLIAFLGQIVLEGELVAAFPFRGKLRDPSDAPFIEVANAGKAGHGHG